ncbi:MAG: type I-MYXAN CRISPR-associated protein Cmx8 [Acidobacteriota bacterium]
MKRKKDSYPDLLEIEYRLAELPSAQHRAGLVGLVLMAGWIKQEYVCRGICDIEMTERGVTLYLDLLGLSELFNGLYAASREEQRRRQPMRSLRTREIIPPVREEVREVADPVRGEVTRTKIFVYESIVPQGAFLAELDPSGDEENGLWIKLWREVVWSIFRGVPATRRPYEARANDERISDYETVWNDLRRGWDYAVQLPGTYFIGAQSLTAEKIPFRDRARHQFLLNFWPLVAQIYVPVQYGPGSDLTLRGFVIAIPDVTRLDLFCRLYSRLLRARSVEPFRPRQFRPAGAVIDLVEEAGLDLLQRLREQAEGEPHPPGVEQVLDGVELFHLEREGNSVRQLHFSRIEPDEGLIDHYQWIRRRFLNPVFRRQQMVNLLRRPGVWYAGYDQLLARLPLAQTFMNGPFRRDVATMFAQYSAAGEGAGPDRLPDVGRLVYELVGGIIALQSGVSARHQVRGEVEEKSLRQLRNRIVREMFLAVRARKGRDFIDYLLSLVGSSRQVDGGAVPVDRLDLNGLNGLMEKRPDEIRTLTLLALIAQAAGVFGEENISDAP